MIKAAIFDLDGTLLDSTEMWENLGKRFLLSQGIYALDGLHDEIWDLSLPESAAYFRREYGVRLSEEEILQALKSLSESVYTKDAPLKKGARRLLTTIEMLDIKRAVATACDADLAKAALERLRIWGSFWGIFSCSEYGAKTSPAIFLKAAQRLGEAPADIVVFEDSLSAVLTAKKAGFITAAVFDPSEKRQALLREKADFYAENLDGLRKMLFVK